jgi:hypothetical protein
MNKAWLGFLVLPLTTVTCKANLEFGCEDGNCTTAATVGAGGGACLPRSPDPDKHGYPDDVYDVLSKRCFTCHQNPPQQHAPRSFLYYEDTQGPYPYPEDGTTPACLACGTDQACLTTNMCVTWVSQMPLHALQDPALLAMGEKDGRHIPTMPAMSDPIPTCEQDILRTWFDTCGSDPTLRDKCLRGTGTPSDPTGMGGAGGMAATSSSSTSSSTSATSSAAGG